MNTAQAGDPVENLGQENGLRFVRKHLSRFFHGRCFTDVDLMLGFFAQRPHAVLGMTAFAPVRPYCPGQFGLWHDSAHEGTIRSWGPCRSSWLCVEALPREVCLDPRLLYNFTPPRFGVERPSHRDVEELLFVRGVIVSYAAIRTWCRKFGQTYANQLRRRRPKLRPNASGFVPLSIAEFSL